ncbi:MAG: VWA domain-containing protein, partial [Campylobacter sp.]|uniref:vWA domain-containing protein n=1 Tax=Campylobacter sp. TaxID=205 RepID=UPI0036066A91
VNIFNVINPAIVRADDTKHFENNAIMVPDGGITAKNYNNGKFDVEMLVKGDGSTITEEKKLDVVLVVDRSYENMRVNRNKKMNAAKAEAARLVDYFLKSRDDKVKVGLVSFAGGDREAKNPIVNHFDLTSNIAALKNEIANYQAAPYANRIPVLEETFTQAGLIEGNKLFANSGNNKKIIVLITGGKPTLSYDEAKEKLIDDPGGSTGNTSRVENNTIAEADEIKTKNNVEIFSVGIKSGPFDYKLDGILSKIASDSRYYNYNVITIFHPKEDVCKSKCQDAIC